MGCQRQRPASSDGKGSRIGGWMLRACRLHESWIDHRNTWMRWLHDTNTSPSLTAMPSGSCNWGGGCSALADCTNHGLIIGTLGCDGCTTRTPRPRSPQCHLAHATGGVDAPRLPIAPIMD